MSPPDNAYWYHLAYTIIVVLYGVYAVTLLLRRRKWRRDRA